MGGPGLDQEKAAQRLSGERAAEMTNASTTGLFDIERQTWAADLMGELGLPSRILAPPRVTKPAITFKLCTPSGTAELADAPRRDKVAYAWARRLDWGDALP